jgi:hypothetical protein
LKKLVLTFATIITLGLYGCGGGEVDDTNTSSNTSTIEGSSGNSDTTPPGNPTLTSAAPAYINTNSLAVEVNGEIGAAVYVNGSATGTVIGGAGKATVNLDTSGADGVKDFSITLKDAALNTSGSLSVSTEKGTTPPSSVSWSNGGGYVPESQNTLEPNLRLAGNISFTGVADVSITSTRGGAISGLIINGSGQLEFNYVTPIVDSDILHITGADKYSNAISIFLTVPLPF